MRMSALLILALLVVTTAGSCGEQEEREPLNPFTDVKPLKIDGRRQALTSLITPLGLFATDEVIEILVESDQARAAYVLKADQPRTEAGVIEKGVIIDGGPIGRRFLHRVRDAGELFLFVDAPTGANVTAAIKRSAEAFRRPAGQTIVLVFEEGFLVDALSDSDLSDDDDDLFLMEIEPQVRRSILDAVREIYEGIPVTFLAEGDSTPEEFSKIKISGDRVTVEELIEIVGPDGANRLDALVVTNCPSVVFGSVLPLGSSSDAGNRSPTDEAVVYAGSFLTPSECATSFVLNSVNNIINALSLTAAHEAGHLLGLSHTALAGLMAKEPTLAFQRQLRFQRSQVTIDDGGTDLQTLTLVIQDPRIYFDHIFSEQ